MLEMELTEHMGYERYEAKGRNSGRRYRSPDPRDGDSEFSSKLREKHQTNTNELEEKILAMYGERMSTRDI